MISYRTYWLIWIVLLALTVFMLLIEAVRIPAAVAMVLLVLAMLTKATFIGGWFMHLRYERAALAVSLVVITLLTAAFLWFLLIPDAVGVHNSVRP